MNNDKNSSLKWFIDQLEEKGNFWENNSIRRVQISIDVSDYLELKKQAKEMHREDVKNAYISGYLDNGYYEGAEEDASKLWEDTYGFAYNSIFEGNDEQQ